MSLVVEVVVPGALGVVAEYPPRLLDRDVARVLARERFPDLDLVVVVLADDRFERTVPDVVGGGYVEDLVAGQVALDREHDGVGQVVDVYVAQEIGGEVRRQLPHPWPQVALVVALVLHPAGPYGDGADVRAPDGPVHEQLREVLGGGVGVLGPYGVLLVNLEVVGQEGSLREKEAGHRLARDVYEA